MQPKTWTSEKSGQLNKLTDELCKVFVKTGYINTEWSKGGTE